MLTSTTDKPTVYGTFETYIFVIFSLKLSLEEAK